MKKGRCQRNPQREAVVAKLRHDGLTFAQIGAKLGITRQRAHAIYRRAVDSAPAQS